MGSDELSLSRLAARASWVALFAVGAAGACVGDFAGLCRNGASECAGVCVELAVDPNHCGACGVTCEGDRSCVDGVCQPPCGSSPVCDGACVDPTTDVRHCGSCGNACDAGAICVDGACEPGCAGESLACPSGCVDALNDEASCGACNAPCASGEVCTLGACSCVDTFTDDANCGACGHRCGVGQRCFDGRCRVLCAGEPCPPATVLGALRLGEDGAVPPTSQREQAATAADFDAEGAAWVAFEARGDNFLFDDRVSAPNNGDILLARLEPRGRVLERRLVGGTGNDRARALRVTPDGGLVVAGTYSGDGALLCGLPLATLSDGFVVRFEADGSCRFGVALASAGVNEVRAVELAPNGDTVVTGWVAEVTSVVPSVGDAVSLPGLGSDDVVVLAITETGALRWHQVVGGPLRDRAYGLAIDSAGAVTVTGEYRGAIQVGADLLPASDTDQDALLLVKLAGATGEIVWGKGFPITSAPVGHNAQGSAVVVGRDDHLWVLGDFVGAIELAPSTTVSSFLTSRDLLLLELDPDGELLRHERIGSEDVEEAASVHLADDGSVVIAGTFRASLDLGSDTLVAVGGRDVFVAALHADEEELSFSWSRAFGGQDEDRLRSAAVHQGVVWLLGTFESDIDLGFGPMWSPWGETDTLPEVRDDGFVAVLAR